MAKQRLATAPHPWQKPSLSFLLVNLRVGLGSIRKEDKVEGHKYDPDTKQQLKQQMVLLNEKGETIKVVESPPTGYPTPKGVVFLEPEDEEAIKSRTKGVIDLAGFCSAEEIDLLDPDSTYYMWPDGPGHTKAFSALAQVLLETGKAGVGTCAFTNRTRLVVIRYSQLVDNLLLHTCNYASEIKWAEIAQARDFALRGGPLPTEAEVAFAREIVTSSGMQVGFREFSETVTDDYQAALRKVVSAKAAGKKPRLPKVEVPKETGDLLEALRSSVAAISQPPKTQATIRRKKAQATRRR